MFPLVLVLVAVQCFTAHDIVNRSVPLSTDTSSVDKMATPVRFQDLREEALQIREEAQKMRSEAYDTMNKVFRMKEEALKYREAAFEERMEVQSTIAETLSLLRGQATASTIYLQEIRNTVNSVSGRLNEVEDKVNSFGERLAALEGKMDVGIEKSKTNEDLISKVQADVNTMGMNTLLIKSRQALRMTEVRLISLYKMTDQSTMHQGGGGGHGSDLAVDGQFVYSHWAPDTPVRTITHTLNAPDQKLWIDLGGLFRIHRVKIWNARHCGTCRDRFVGTHVYAGERLLGVATSGEFIYDYKVAENDATYARSVTLHQIRAMWLHVSEVQVWGIGPFSQDDKFA